MSEEEKKAINDLKILCYEVLGQDDCYRYDNYSASEKMTMVSTVLNLIEKQQKVANLQEKTIQLMAEEIKEITGSCPLDIFDYDLDCENKCEQEIDGKCWAEYFRNKAKESE